MVYGAIKGFRSLHGDNVGVNSCSTNESARKEDGRDAWDLLKGTIPASYSKQWMEAPLALVKVNDLCREGFSRWMVDCVASNSGKGASPLAATTWTGAAQNFTQEADTAAALLLPQSICDVAVRQQEQLCLEVGSWLSLR